MVVKLQIGKGGVSEGFLEQLKKSFSNEKMVRVSVLRSFSRKKEEIKNAAEKMVGFLGQNYNYRIVGFVVIIMKFRKNVR